MTAQNVADLDLDPLAGLEGPSVAELAVLQFEEPVIVADLEYVTAELAHMRRPSRRSAHRVRRAARAAAVARAAVVPALAVVAAAALCRGGETR